MDVLFSVGADVVLVLLAAVLVVMLLRRRRPATVPGGSAAVSSPRPTVAHAVAIREAETAPLPISSATVLARSAIAPDVPEPVAVDAPAEAETVEPGRIEQPVGVAPSADTTTPPQTPRHAVADSTDADAAATPVSAVAQPAVIPTPVIPDPLPASEPAPTPRGDLRDRLLAVLLDDPVRALGATVDLESTTSQLARLTAAVSREREALGDVVSRLSAVGLRPEQVATLSGLPAAEVRSMLGTVTS